MGQTTRIKGFRPMQRLLERSAERAFISHRPNDDARAVFVPVDAPFHAVDDGSGKGGIVGDRRVEKVVIKVRLEE